MDSKIFELDDSLNVPKYLQLVSIIETWISEGTYKCGDKLPSINELSYEFEVARDTVDKAFTDLKERGIVSSTKGKGFYVSLTNIKHRLLIGLFFNRMTSYNQDIYYVLYNKLKNVAFIDLMIYHNDTDIFHEQIERYSKIYDYFIVIPTIWNDTGMIDILNQLPRNKIIILKRVLNEFKGRFAAIYQDIYSDILQALNAVYENISKYRIFKLIYPEQGYSKDIMKGFISFCKINECAFEIIDKVDCVHEGEAYFVLDDNDLIELIKLQRQAKLSLGNQVGIIAYEDNPVKSILSGGITCIQLNSIEIGNLCAEMIESNNLQKIRVPFSLINRGSL